MQKLASIKSQSVHQVGCMMYAIEIDQKICLFSHSYIYMFGYTFNYMRICPLQMGIKALPIPYPTYDLVKKLVRELQFQTMSS